jgi:glycosyltransferase involved in cell wall biosynthesis
LKIGFDAKRAFHNLTGLGNYSRSVIKSVSNTQPTSQLYLFTTSIKKNIFKPTNQNTHTVAPKRFINKNYWRLKGVNKELKDLNINIFHGLSNEIPFGINIKSIVTIHDLLFLKYPKYYNFFDRNIYKFKSKYACENSSQIIATSKQTKQDIINYFNIDEKKIKVIYQSCHSDFIKCEENERLIYEFKDELRDPYILYVGSIEERKNLLFLLQAIKHIKEVKLICVGRKTKYYKKVHKFICKNNLAERVSFLDVEDSKKLSLIYQKSRGLVFPSIDEGFGIPIIEAMYSKAPVITSNKSVFKEIAGENSYFFEENKIDSLIAEIKKIWFDSQDRDHRIQLNLNYVKKFNEENQAVEIIKMYRKLI